MARSHDNNNKVLHRFYEPLMLLFALDQTQGEHTQRPGYESHHLQDVGLLELQRRFLGALAYACDFKKGGDTVTAIWVCKVPLTYYVACNKSPKDKVKIFVRNLTSQLALLYEDNESARQERKANILATCVSFSESRLATYQEELTSSLEQCIEESRDEACTRDLKNMQQTIKEVQGNLHGLCIMCEKLIRSPKLDFVRKRANTSEQNGSRECKFARLRHFVGRLAWHVKTVEILVAAGVRLAEFFDGPEFEFVNALPAKKLDLGLRNKANLKSIVGRMISGEENLKKDICERLDQLDDQHHIGTYLRNEFNKENFRPRIHCEVRLLEHLYQNRDDVRLDDNDRYIGCSKPACYCCALYIREHPGRFVSPESHQKVYVQWLPPTSVETINAQQRRHERNMLDRMVVSVRERTISQIMTCTGGRRPKHFDSVTGDTFTVSESMAHLDLDGYGDQDQDQDRPDWGPEEMSSLPMLTRASSSGADSDVTAVPSVLSTNSSEEQLLESSTRYDNAYESRASRPGQNEEIVNVDEDSDDDDGGVLLMRGGRRERL